MGAPEPILVVRDLAVAFTTRRGLETVMDGAHLEVPRGARVGLVGESGCGKSTLLKAAIGALASNARVLRGQVIFDGVDVLDAHAETIRRMRWSRISMIPQSALNALDPVLRVSDQIVEAIRAHIPVSDAQAHAMAADAVERVGIDRARMDQYPHQFSGGMRQRAVIAMALALTPDLVLADEPTTSLDVIVQDQIFRLIREKQDEIGFALLLVTHDIALAIESCDRLAVMYGGAVVEEGPTAGVVEGPFHPYTLGLLNSVPSIGLEREPISIPGSPPDPLDRPAGCSFAPRCPFAVSLCRDQKPALQAVGEGHTAACHRRHEMPRLREAAGLVETWGARTAPAAA